MVAATQRTPRRITNDELSFRLEPVAGDMRTVGEIVSSTGFFSPSEIELAVELVAERMEKGAASGYHFVFAWHGVVVAGYSCYGPIPATASSFDLYWIVVHKAEQARGIGSLLLAKTEEMVRGMGGTRLYAETSSRKEYAPSRRFYESCGFTAEAFQENFYAPGDGKTTYVKELGAER